MPKHAPLQGIVLAGGRSRRMGTEKAVLAYHDEPEVRRAYDLIKDRCESAFLSLREEQYRHPAYADLPPVFDAVEGGGGPVIGIYSAFQRHPDAAWLAVGSDMPYMSGGALDFLLRERDPERDVTCFRAGDGGGEPLCAIYEPSCAASLAEAIAAGRYSVRRLFQHWNVKLVDPPDGENLSSINTPDERAQAEQTLSQSETSPCN